MPLLSEPFSFSYFGHTILASSLGPVEIPDISRIISVHVVPLATDGSIIAINVTGRGWDIPGGHVDEGEPSPLSTLSREAREEANLTTLEPILIDVLTLKCETLDLSAKPYMLVYAAQVWDLGDFTPSDEVSERSLMSKKKFISNYFGNTTYATRMIDAAMRAITPDLINLTSSKARSDDSSPTSQKNTQRKAKRIKVWILAISVIAVVILFSLPLIRMLDTNRRLHAVSLPLSNEVVAMGGNGLTTDRTNISFIVNKNYANAREAKDDIIARFEAAGISIPQPSYGSFVSPKGNGASNVELINEIHTSYFSKNGTNTEFTFLLERVISCGFESTGGKFVEYQCEGKTVNDMFVDKLVNSQPVSSVRVHTSVK